MVRLSFGQIKEGGKNGLNDEKKSTTINDPLGLIKKGTNFYQLNNELLPGQKIQVQWKGHRTIAGLTGQEITGVSHKGHLSGWVPFFGDWGSARNPDEPKSIMLDPQFRSDIIAEAVAAYLAREQGDVSAKRDPLVD